MSSAEKKRHFLPAASIGYFSFASEPERLRERPVFVLRKDAAQPYVNTAEKVGVRKYGYGYARNWDWDEYFKTGERYVHEPVDNIMRDGPDHIRFQDWAYVAWYITTLITRGPDLEIQLEQQASEMGWDPRGVSPGYVMDAQRASTAVLRARWALEWSVEREFVLPDRGITGLFYPPWDSYAYHVPLRKNFAVLLGPAPYPKQAYAVGEEWHIELAHHMRPGRGADWINSLAWLAARSECYGPDEEQLVQARADAERLPDEIAPITQLYEGAQLLGLTIEERMKDELLLLSLVSGVRPPEPGGPTELVV